MVRSGALEGWVGPEFDEMTELLDYEILRRAIAGPERHAIR